MGFFQKYKEAEQTFWERLINKKVDKPTLYQYIEDEVGHEERVDRYGNVWDTERQALLEKYHYYINQEVREGRYRSMFTCNDPRPYKMPKEEFIKKYKKK